MSIGAAANDGLSIDLQAGVKPAVLDTTINCGDLPLGESVIPRPTLCPSMFLPTATALNGYDLILSVDTEYTKGQQRRNIKGQLVDANEILSYQYSAVLRVERGYLYAEAILYPEKGQRLRYTDILIDVFNQFGFGYCKAEGLRILNLAHFGIAEWSSYADREDYIDHLTVIRKVPITLKPMAIKLPFPQRHSAEVSVTWRDTRLVAPGSGSLDSISQATVHKKVKLPPGQIENMRSLLENNRPLFEHYAINDARVTLEYYCQFLQKLEALTGLTKEPLTLGDAAVRAYLHHVKQEGRDADSILGLKMEETINQFGRLTKTKIKTGPRLFSEPLASQGFQGGFNTAFEVGYRRHEEGFIYLDVDLGNAYPVALAVLPAIDWTKPNRSTKEPSLQTDAKHTSYLPISLFHVQFEFPKGSRHACLPVASPIGLLYPRKGHSTCTGPEIELARKMGAKIKIIEARCFASQMHSKTKEVQLAFASFLGQLTRQRATTKKGSLENLLLKELANSFYGKTAQGLDFRTIRDLRGEKKSLPPSKVTCGHYAAMCTGIIRTALLSLIVTAESFENVAVLSATTDGCILRLPYIGPFKYNDKGDPIPPHLDAAHPELWAALNELPAIKALKAGRENMGLNPAEWLESKHLGDSAYTAKTRGYMLRWGKTATFLARCGHQLKDADEFEALCNSPGIPRLTKAPLATLQDIVSGRQVDLVEVSSECRSNTDYDFKRVLLEDGSTRLPETVDEIFKNRLAADAVRQSGEHATATSVALKLEGIQLNGGSEKALERFILRAVTKNIGGWRPFGLTDVAIAEALGVSITDYKNAKRAKFKALAIKSPALLEALMVETAAKLKIKLTDGMRSALTQR